MDLFLRFPSSSDAVASFRAVGMTWIDDEGSERLAQVSHQHALWEVGEITGKDGWHVNLRVLDPEMDLSALEPYRVYPANPVCVWA